MMMIIHRLPILGIILTIHPFIRAMPLKNLIDFDISEELPHRTVKIVLSEAYPGGTHFFVDRSAMGRNVIGMVRDAEEILVDGDPTAISRYILVQNRQDGMRYIRVITRWRICGNSFRRHVDEFKRGPIDLYYMQIFRVPIEVDVLTQKTNHMIQVEKDTGMVQFTIQPEMAMEITIGVVRYGHYIVDDKVDGLMERKVTWYGGLDTPKITVTSRYNDGTEVEAKYKFSYSHEGFRVMGSVKRFAGLLE